jgi:C4-dicarboxylate transporter/malic acid transport protein
MALGAPGGRRLLPALDRPSDALAHLGPNWFGAVMGTAIVASATVTVPVHLPGQRAAALVLWVAAAVLLVLLLVGTGLHWLRHPHTARGHVLHPVMSHFYGAPPIALLSVGSGCLLVGQDLLGLRLAVVIDSVLWAVGTVAGLLSAAVVPYAAFTRHDNAPDSAFGGWLLPVLPPMVSAGTGALLVPHLPEAVQRTALIGCGAMFGLSALTSLVLITMIWSRLVQHDVGAAETVPTLWILLAPLGQAVMTAELLGRTAAAVVPGPAAEQARVLATLLGLAVWGFALLWLVLAAAVTVRVARQHLPFSLTWWGYTLGLGSLAGATSQLSAQLGSAAVEVLGATFYLGLLAAWLLVATRTARGALHGRLFLPVGVPA